MTTDKTKQKNPSAKGELDPSVDKSQLVAGELAYKKEAAKGSPTHSTKEPKSDSRPTETKKIKELESKFKELEDKYIRLRAEYDNHIKRTNKEKGELISYAGGQVFRLILPILDDLHRTVNHARQDESQKDDPIVTGVSLIVDKFDKVLESEGVKVFASVGETFNPELHEALLTKSSNDHPPGIVLEEYEPGYVYRDRVIRHAKVVVSG